MEDSLTTVVAIWSKRLTKPFQSYCVDNCLVYDIKQLPTEIKINRKSAWIMIVGNDLPKLKNTSVRYFGNWTRGIKGQLQFKAISYEVIPPKTQKGLEAYLSSSLFKGVGKIQAKKIVSTFGDDTIKVIKESPEKLEKLIGKNDAEKVVKQFRNASSYSQLFETLGKYGVTQNMILKIYDRFGSDARNIITFNPYRLLECHMPFAQCDKIALGEGYSLDSYERIQGHFAYELQTRETQTGNTVFSEAEIGNAVYTNLNKDKKCVSIDKFKETYEKICSKNDGVVKRKLTSGNYVLSRTADYEEYEISRKLLCLSNKQTDEITKTIIKRELDKHCEKSEIKLSEKQKLAVYNALVNHASVITGGPGTGKTTIITAIIAVYENVYRNPVILMAPTGKAARRMSEATGRDATTIHSRLGIYGFEGAPISVDKIDNGLVIIDETSMVDLHIMSKISEYINSDRINVVFVGDIDQLPSVGAGCVLSQLIESEIIQTTRLTETFRQKDGSAIIDNAIAINSGKVEDIKFNDNDFIFVDAKSEEEAKDKILDIYLQESKLVGIDNIALLCPLRQTGNDKYLVSSNGLNPLIQDAVNPKDNYTRYYKMSNGNEFRVNDRVLQWKNTKTSFNGDIGIIKDIVEEDDGDVIFTIEWDNGNTVKIPKNEMNSIELGYSMSIHKSQGSEYKTVIIPMMYDQMKMPIMKRNLIYTGITRAKQKIIIVGSKIAFNRCCQDTKYVKRTSLLANRMKCNAKKRA